MYGGRRDRKSSSGLINDCTEANSVVRLRMRRMLDVVDER